MEEAEGSSPSGSTQKAGRAVRRTVGQVRGSSSLGSTQKAGIIEDMKIKKAVIAAAGAGTRFLPVVKAYPKELIPILDKPNLQYLVEEMIGAGIEEIAIVHRHGDPLIKKYFTPDPKLEEFLKKTGKEHYLDSLRAIWKKVKKFRFIPQPNRLPYGNAAPVLAAKGFIANEPFVYAYGDDLILEKSPGKFLSSLIATFQKYQPEAVATAAEFPWQDLKRYSSIKFSSDKIPNQIVDLIEKPATRKEAFTNFNAGMRFIVSPKVFSVLAKQEISRGELWFPDTIQQLAKTGLVIGQLIKDAEWMTTGDPLRWLKVNLKIAFEDKEMKKELKTFLKKLGLKTK